jgi:hypothetical protein
MNRYKPDWKEASERLTRWWAGKETDRVVALVTSPCRGVKPCPPRLEVPDKYTDMSTVFHNLDAALESTFFGGEAFPGHWVYLGPIPLAGYMGCEMHFEPGTVWHSPCRTSWAGAETISFGATNQWYQLLCDLTALSAQRAHGEYLVSGQGFGCVSDVIADMWGTENTLMAMADSPGIIKAVTRELVGISKQLYDELDAIVDPYQKGSFDWLYLWAPGRVWTLQSDLCCMLSPEMFAEFVLDELREEAEYVDFSFYHLDGPGAIKHLDAILGIKALGGIQWVPGAGASQDPLDWIDLFRRVQAAGKKLMISCPPDRVQLLLSRISRQGVCLRIGCDDQTTAERLLLDLDRSGAG